QVFTSGTFALLVGPGLYAGGGLQAGGFISPGNHLTSGSDVIVGLQGNAGWGPSGGLAIERGLKSGSVSAGRGTVGPGFGLNLAGELGVSGTLASPFIPPSGESPIPFVGLPTPQDLGSQGKCI